MSELLAAAVIVGPGFPPAPAPVTAVAAAAPPHLVPVSLGGTRTDELLTRVGAMFDGAVDAVDGFWGADWPGGVTREITVVATGSDAQFIAATGLDPGRRWTDIAAVAVADHLDEVRRKASGQRIVLAPGASAMSDTALRTVVTHELFHLAARADTAADAPRWLTEGVADFVAREPTPVPPSAAADADLPDDSELDSEGPRRSAAYDRAWWFARFVADAYGRDALRRLYLSACRPGHAEFADSVREALGTDLQSLRTGWVKWLGHGGAPERR